MLPSLTKASTSWPLAKLPVMATRALASVALSTSLSVRLASITLPPAFSMKLLLPPEVLTTGASFTAVTLTLMMPSAGPLFAASRMRVVMVKFWSLSAEGVRATAARAALTSVREPVTLHTPVPGL